jgi:mRNA interferase RelE/StbE
MNVRYSKRFSKDLDEIKNIPNVKKRLLEVIQKIKAADSITYLQGVRKIQGYSGYFRIKIGDYRLGTKLSRDGIEIIRFLHRKEIYRRFP